MTFEGAQRPPASAEDGCENHTSGGACFYVCKGGEEQAKVGATLADVLESVRAHRVVATENRPECLARKTKEDGVKTDFPGNLNSVDQNIH